MSIEGDELPSIRDRREFKITENPYLPLVNLGLIDAITAAESSLPMDEESLLGDGHTKSADGEAAPETEAPETPTA